MKIFKRMLKQIRFLFSIDFKKEFMRSFWKGPVLLTMSPNKQEQFKIISRSTTIFPCFVGKTFLVKNGKNSLKKLQISVEMVGFKIGEFVFTKKVY